MLFHLFQYGTSINKNGLFKLGDILRDILSSSALNVGHSFNWNVLLSPPKNTRTRKNLEAVSIAKMKPSFNEKVESNALSLFRNSVT